MFGLGSGPGSQISDCGTVGHERFNQSLTVLKQQCVSSVVVEFTGTVECEVLGMIAESLVRECGPTCGLNEVVKVNGAENSLYCACDGKCLHDFKDDTLNGLVGTLVGLFLIQVIVNFSIMINSRYNLGLFGARASFIPVVGKSV